MRIGNVAEEDDVLGDAELFDLFEGLGVSVLLCSSENEADVRMAVAKCCYCREETAVILMKPERCGVEEVFRRQIVREVYRRRICGIVDVTRRDVRKNENAIG